MIATIFYLFFNSVILERFVLGRAKYEETTNNPKSAIVFYNVAYTYYNINHYSQTNKEIYFDVPYRISLCYLKDGNREKSVQTILDAVTSVQMQYGLFSEETAYFLKKYLIEYYLINNNISLAQQEFNNLLTIYKKIGCDDSIIFDIMCLRGDLYYKQKNYEEAMPYYEKAYNYVRDKKNIDYDVLVRIVDKICENKINQKEPDSAISIYQDTINLLKNSGGKQSDLTAGILIELGDLYAQEDTKTKEAIKCYEEAIQIIKKLPKSFYLKQNITAYFNILKELYNKDGQFNKASDLDLELARRRRFSFFY